MREQTPRENGIDDNEGESEEGGTREIERQRRFGGGEGRRTRGRGFDKLGRSRSLWGKYTSRQIKSIYLTQDFVLTKTP